MDLSEFVQTTLTQIIEGVTRAQELASESEAVVNARAVDYRDLRVTTKGHEIREIEFDVAVVTESGTGGGAKISVMGVGLGLDGSSKNSVASRIKFGIPIALPPAPQKSKNLSATARAVFKAD